MTRHEFLHKVAERSGLAPDDAERATRSVLAPIGERLSRLEAEALAEDLPRGIGDGLRGPSHGADFDVRGLHERVARRAGVRLGIAVEYTSTVCGVLGEAVSGDVLHRIAKELPPEWVDLFTPIDRAEYEPRPHLHPERRTLAEGQPGGREPLYSGRDDHSQSDSIMRADNPHGDTKLASARGLTQERDDETLAAGRPGAKRSLADPEG